MDYRETRREYEDRGFVTVRGLLSRAELDAIDAELARYRVDVAPGLPASEIVWEPPVDGAPRAIRNLWRLERHSAFFADFVRTPRLLELAGALVNGEAEVWGAETFEKPARVGSVVPPHQDNAYFNFVPPDAFSLWIALDASTRENGCVHYAPGTHRELRPHVASGVAGNSMGLASVPGGLAEEPALLEPGDAVCHHCQVIHRSEPNRSERSRRGFVIVYRGKHTSIDPERAASYRAIAEANIARQIAVSA